MYSPQIIQEGSVRAFFEKKTEPVDIGIYLSRETSVTVILTGKTLRVTTSMKRLLESSYRGFAGQFSPIHCRPNIHFLAT